MCSPIFAEIVPERARTSIYALDRSFESILGSFAPPIVGILAQHVYGYKPFPKGSTNSEEIETDRENAAAKSHRGKNGKDDDDDDKIPEAVWERIMFRILFYVGVPLVTGVALLQVFSIMKEQNLWDVPIWLPFLTTFLTFGASALGIAYGTLSTSWDAQREGSFLGFEEAQKNWVEIWKEEEE